MDRSIVAGGDVCRSESYLVLNFPQADRRFVILTARIGVNCGWNRLAYCGWNRLDTPDH